MESGGAEAARGKVDDRFAMDALTAFVASILLSVLSDIGLGYLFYIGVIPENPDVMGVVIAVADVISIGLMALPAAIVLYVHRETVDWGQFRVPGPRQLALTAVIGACFAVVAVYLEVRSAKILAGGVYPYTPIWGDYSILLRPLAWALLYYTVLQTGLERHWGGGLSVLLTALIFGLPSTSYFDPGSRIVLALLAGIVFIQTSNYWCAALVFFIHSARPLVLWRYVLHLDLLPNPMTAVILVAAALAAALMLRNSEALSLDVLRGRARQVISGLPQIFAMPKERSRRVILVTLILLSAMTAWSAYTNYITMRAVRRAQMAMQQSAVSNTRNDAL